MNGFICECISQSLRRHTLFCTYVECTAADKQYSALVPLPWTMFHALFTWPYASTSNVYVDLIIQLKCIVCLVCVCVCLSVPGSQSILCAILAPSGFSSFRHFFSSVPYFYFSHSFCTRFYLLFSFRQQPMVVSIDAVRRTCKLLN